VTSLPKLKNSQILATLWVWDKTSVISWPLIPATLNCSLQKHQVRQMTTAICKTAIWSHNYHKRSSKYPISITWNVFSINFHHFCKFQTLLLHFLFHKSTGSQAMATPQNTAMQAQVGRVRKALRPNRYITGHFGDETFHKTISSRNIFHQRRPLLRWWRWRQWSHRFCKAANTHTCML